MQKKAFFIIGVLFLAFGLIYFFSRAKLEVPDEAFETEVAEEQVALLAVDSFAGVSLEKWDTATVKIDRRSLLFDLLNPYGFSYEMVMDLAALPDSIFNERRISVHDRMVVFFAKGDTLKQAQKLLYSKAREKYTLIALGDSLVFRQGVFPFEIRRVELAGEIRGSLYQTIADVGGDLDLAYALEDIYGWSLDFYRIRKGDYFKVIYTEKWVEGKRLTLDLVEAALFNHRGEDHWAFAYDQGEGWDYFDEVGNSQRKAFLKAPLKYSRISSRFSYSRLHPVLKIRRPHLGVDYAAPTGTPIYSVGDGEIIKKGYARGNGNYLKIKHGGPYETMYLHLSKFASGIQKGSRVKQGQLIGYVGSTGISTGPHLDYRIFRYGKPVNPLTLKLPPSHPVKEELKELFMEHSDSLQRRLQSIPISNGIQSLS